MTQARRASRTRGNERARKERRSFTLSREAIALLAELCVGGKSKKRRSASSVLDELLRSLDKERKRRAVEQTISEYYSAAAEENRAEAQEWGDFSLAQFEEDGA